MGLEDLSDEILFRVIHYLPLKEQARIGRVNKQFRRVSKTAISKIKSLDLNDHPFNELTPDSFRSILELCSTNLEQLRIRDVTVFQRWVCVEHDYESTMIRLVEIFAQFSCPNLIELEISSNIPNGVFGQLMRNNANLKEVQVTNLWCRGSLILPDDFVHENLETLKIQHDCTDVMLASFRFPNLRTLQLQLSKCSANVLDDFFASCPNITKLTLTDVDYDGTNLLHHIQEAVVSFWCLPLRSLTINSYGDSAIFNKIAASFPHLQEFNAHRLFPTNDDIAAMGALQYIEKIVSTDSDSELDEGLCELIQCPNLQHLEIRTVISPTTLITLVNGCHALRHLEITAVEDVENSDTAAEIAQSFNGFGANLTIIMRLWSDIWKSDEVKKVLENLKETGNRVIVFEKRYDYEH